MFDNVFYCDGAKSQGFGHVARCIMLARLLIDENPKRGVAFCGQFDEAVMERIRDNLTGVSIVPAGSFPAAGTAIVDRMAESEDPDAWDDAFLESTCGASEKVVYIASGSVAPPPRKNLISIGYLPFSGNEPRRDIFWSMKFAPVPPGFRTDVERSRDGHQAFVGMGGGGDRQSLRAVLQALDDTVQIRSIDVLVSPVARYETTDIEISKPVTFHWNVPALVPFLSGAGLVVASFGNLMIEALCLGAPVSIVGLKAFQAVYGQHFEDAQLAYYAGNPRTASRETLAAVFAKTLEDAESLSTRARASIDDRGLLRIASLIDGTDVSAANWESVS